MKSKILVISMALILVLTLLFGACAKPAPAPAPAPTPVPTPAPAPKPAPSVTLVWSAPQTSKWVVAQGWQRWADAVEERTDGRIKVRFFWGGSLSKPGEELEALESGLAEVTMANFIYYPARFPLNGVAFSVPFGLPNTVMELKLIWKLMEHVPELTQEIEQYNLHPLFPAFLPSYQITTTKPVKNLADLKGLKIAAVGNLPKILEAVGVVPVIQSANERYSSMQTGVVDGQIMDIHSTESWKLAEVGKYAFMIDMGSVSLGAVSLSKDAWNKLSPEGQKILTEEGEKAALWTATTIDAAVNADIEKWKAEGVEFYYISDEDAAAWAEAAKSVPYNWAMERDAKGLAGTKTMDAYFTLAEELGHKFPYSWR